MSEDPRALLARDLAWLDEYEASMVRKWHRRNYAVRLGAAMGVPEELARDWTDEDLRWIERQIQMTTG